MSVGRIRLIFNLAIIGLNLICAKAFFSCSECFPIADTQNFVYTAQRISHATSVTQTAKETRESAAIIQGGCLNYHPL